MNENKDYFLNWYKLKENLIEKYKITNFFSLETSHTKTNATDQRLLHVIVNLFNKHYIFAVIGENCLIIPKLAATKWGYFEAIINRYSTEQESAIIIDITHFVIDTNIFTKIAYTRFTTDFLRLLYETNYTRMYWKSYEMDGWKPLVDLLIPPPDFWKERSDSSSPFLWSLPNLITSTRTGNVSHTDDIDTPFPIDTAILNE